MDTYSRSLNLEQEVRGMDSVSVSEVVKGVDVEVQVDLKDVRVDELEKKCREYEGRMKELERTLARVRKERDELRDVAVSKGRLLPAVGVSSEYALDGFERTWEEAGRSERLESDRERLWGSRAADKYRSGSRVGESEKENVRPGGSQVNGCGYGRRMWYGVARKVNNEYRGVSVKQTGCRF